MSRPCPAHVPPCPAHVPPCPAQVRLPAKASLVVSSYGEVVVSCIASGLFGLTKRLAQKAQARGPSPARIIPLPSAQLLMDCGSDVEAPPISFSGSSSASAMARADAGPLPSEPFAEWCLAGFKCPSANCLFP
eukprot:9476083-Alexandrium_andersonii.AAC.1